MSKLLFRRRTAESKLADTELQIEALESKVSSLGQLLESEKAAAESALKASEQSWQARLDESVSAATTAAQTAAEEEAKAVQSALQQQLDDANAGREVTCKPGHVLSVAPFSASLHAWLVDCLGRGDMFKDSTAAAVSMSACCLCITLHTSDVHICSLPDACHEMMVQLMLYTLAHAFYKAILYAHYYFSLSISASEAAADAYCPHSAMKGNDRSCLPVALVHI